MRRQRAPAQTAASRACLLRLRQLVSADAWPEARATETGEEPSTSGTAPAPDRRRHRRLARHGRRLDRLRLALTGAGTGPLHRCRLAVRPGLNAVATHRRRLPAGHPPAPAGAAVRHDRGGLPARRRSPRPAVRAGRPARRPLGARRCPGRHLRERRHALLHDEGRQQRDLGAHRGLDVGAVPGPPSTRPSTARSRR